MCEVAEGGVVGETATPIFSLHLFLIKQTTDGF